MVTNKNIFCLFAIFFLQFLATSCDFCGCGSIKTFEVLNNNVNLTAWDTSGFKDKFVTADAVNKNSFGISILVDAEFKEIACSKPKTNLSALGFSAAYACSCPSDNYINNNPITSIEISVTNLLNNEIIDVTNNFTIYDFGEQISIKEYIENREINMNYYQNDSFDFDMTRYDNIPNLSVFTIKIILKSGKELSEETQEINFI